MAIVKKIADQEYVSTTVVKTVEDKMNEYILPVGGDEVGGVKNGGNVVIDVDGTMNVEIPTKTSDLTNDSGFITQYTETDPTVPAWAKAASKPTYTASEVGADTAGTSAAAVSQHNTSKDAHNDIRIELKALADRLAAFLDSDDITLDQLSELIAGINSNKSLIEAVTTGAVRFTEQNLTEEQKAQVRENIGIDAGFGAGSKMEPAEDDIPKVFFGGALPQTKDDTIMPFRYISKTEDIKGYCKAKAQGNSSMNYPKKNQTVKLYRDAACTEKLKVDFKGWGKQYKHVYKANWIDLTHSRNIVSARLWSDVVKSRNNYNNLPELLRTSPNQGAIDGFPVKVYADGVYQGRYTLNIPKDAWAFNMDDSLDNHCILCGENYVSGCFRSAANINESDWTDEIHDTVPSSIKTRWNEVISFVMNSTDDEFKANLGNYFYVDSLIDYHLFGLASCGLDAYGKNQLYGTYDGQKWFASMYDMDSTWGLYWNGSKILSSSYGRNEYEDMISGREGNLLYMRLEKLFWSEIQARWAELRIGALSIENIINRFERFTDIATPELVKEDYASTTGNGKFTGIPSQSSNNIQQIRGFILARRTWVDEYIANIHTVPCEGIILDKTELIFNEDGMQTITATIEPADTTDAVVWVSSDPLVATIDVDGNVCTVQSVNNGDAIITVTCGNYSASCSVTVNRIDSSMFLYRLPEAATFDGADDFIDTGVKLFDTEKDFTILCEVNAPAQTSNGTIFHCIDESGSPWPGLCVMYSTERKSYDIGGRSDGLSSSYMNFVLSGMQRYGIVVKDGIITLMALRDGNGDYSEVVLPEQSFKRVTQTLVLGAYQNASGVKGRFFNGAINRFDVYNSALDETTVRAFLNEGTDKMFGYALTEPVTFDTSGKYINTGVRPFSCPTDFTIVTDAEVLDDSAQRTIFDCRQSLSNGIETSGVYLMAQKTTSFIGYRAASGMVGSNESSNRYIKVAAVYEKGVLKAIYRRGNNGLGELIKTDITNGAYVAHSAPLILGGVWGWSATVNTPQYVKVNRFYIFGHALSVGEVAEYLPETNYTVSEFSPVWSDNASYNTNTTTGEVVSGTNWLTLDAIELPESAVGLILKVNDSECQYLGCTQYDKNMTFVRKTEATTGDYEVVFDRATKFIRVGAFPNYSGTGVISRVTAEFLCEEE